MISLFFVIHEIRIFLLRKHISGAPPPPPPQISNAAGYFEILYGSQKQDTWR